MTLILPPARLLIGGTWREASAGTIPVVNPSDGATFAEIARGGAADIAAAVRAARSAFEGAWGRVPPVERGRLLMKLARAIADPLASLSLVPLVEVAWADGTVDEKEKISVLDAVVRRGFQKESNEYGIVIQWLGRKPSPDLLEAWLSYVRGLCELLSPAEKKTLKDGIIGHARAVAQASGGFLGMGNKISKIEDEMLKRLEGAFD